VDQRLFKIAGRRPERLTRSDTPEVARALTAYYRRQAQVTSGVLNEVAYIRLVNPGVIDVVVRWDDWVKILPYITNGTFDTTLVPIPTLFVAQPSILSDGSSIGQTDELYERILTILNRLFTVEFPQSI
jgi:hypothetical protein